MNSLLAVLIPRHIKNPDEWVVEAMKPFDLNLKVKQYRDYLSQVEIDYLMEYYEFTTNFELLMKKNEFKETFFEDEKGIFTYSDSNRDWKWSNWGVSKAEPFKDFKIPFQFTKKQWNDHSIAVEDMNDFYFSSFLNPKGEWRDCHEFGWSQINEDFNPAKNKVAWEKWQLFANAEMADYKDHVVLSVTYQC